GIEDFAGGTVVHVNAGSAGLALAIVLGKRRGWGKDPMRPHNLPLVLLGAGLLWFGWFGFNAGSELAADGTAALAFINTQIATAAAAGGWVLVERFRDGKPPPLGIASGAVAGLVAITPACAFIAPWAAIVLGLLAGAICAYAIGLKHRLGFDDALDVVGVHLVGGAFGAVSLGFLAAYPLLDGQRKGLFYGGGFTQLGVQALGPVAVGLSSFSIAWILGKIIDKTMGFRVSAEDEMTGVDLTQHAETAYDFGSIHLGHTPGHAVTGADQEVADQSAESVTGARARQDHPPGSSRPSSAERNPETSAGRCGVPQGVKPTDRAWSSSAAASNRGLPADSRGLMLANPDRGRRGNAVRGIEENLLERAGQVAVPHHGCGRDQRMMRETDENHGLANHGPRQPDQLGPASGDDAGAGQHRGGPVRGRGEGERHRQR